MGYRRKVEAGNLFEPLPGTPPATFVDVVELLVEVEGFLVAFFGALLDLAAEAQHGLDEEWVVGCGGGRLGPGCAVDVLPALEMS